LLIGDARFACLLLTCALLIVDVAVVGGGVAAIADVDDGVAVVVCGCLLHVVCTLLCAADVGGGALFVEWCLLCGVSCCCLWCCPVFVVCCSLLCPVVCCLLCVVWCWCVCCVLVVYCSSLEFVVARWLYLLFGV